MKKASVLIVDDDISLCKTMSLVLRRKGYHVATAKDGPEALEILRESAFDIVFLDIRMPVMDGVETHRKIKQIRPQAVVMMMTAYTVEDLVQDALREGAYGIMYKPLDMDRVVNVIEEVKEGRKGALILVVDDDSGTCDTLKKVLTRKGYRVGTAHDGEAAVAMARERAYEIIIIDMKLPTMNGLQTYLAIKEINPEAVAVMMTAYRQEMEELVEESIKNNAYTCLYKPLDMERVLKLIEEIQERRKRAR